MIRKSLKKVLLLISAVVLMMSVPVVVSAVALPYEQNFDDGNISGMTLSGDADVCNIVDYEGGKVFKLAYSANYGAPSLRKEFGDMTRGTLHIEADLKPTGGKKAPLQVFLTLKNDEPKNLVGFDSESGVRFGWNGTEYLKTYDVNMWYHICIDIDVAKGTMDATISDKNNIKSTLNNMKVFDAGSIVDGVYFQIWGNDVAGTAYIDNIEAKVIIDYAQNFDAGNMLGLTLERGDSTACKMVDCLEGYNKVYRLLRTNENPTPMLKRDLYGVSDGKIGIEADVKSSGKENCQANIFLTITDPDGKSDLKNLIGFSCETGVRIGWNGIELLEDYDEEWYHLRFVIDVASGKADAMIKGENGAESSVEGIQVFSPGSSVEDVYFQRWGNDYGALYVDNISITDSPKPLSIPSARKIIYSDDFDNYNNISDTVSKWSFSAASEETAISVKGGNDKYLTLGLNNDKDNAQAKYAMPCMPEQGKMAMTFDVKPGDGVSTHIALYGEELASPLLFFAKEDKGIYAGINWTYGETLGTWTQDAWYNCEVVIDFDTKTFDVICKPQNDTDAVMSKIGIPLLDVDKIMNDGGYKSFLFQIWNYVDASSGFDNLKIMVEGFAVVNETIYEGDKEITSLSELKNASNPVLRISYENSSKEAVSANVYINSYKDNRLIDCKIKKLDIEEYRTKGLKDIALKEEIAEEVDCVNVLIWEESLTPASDKIEFK